VDGRGQLRVPVVDADKEPAAVPAVAAAAAVAGVPAVAAVPSEADSVAGMGCARDVAAITPISAVPTVPTVATVASRGTKRDPARHRLVQE
jgi:hypothetical protein